MPRKTRRPAAQMRAKPAARKMKPRASAAPKRARGAKSSRDKVRAHRERMRAKGLRLVQMWVPDTGDTNSAEEPRQWRRSRAEAAAIRKAWAEVLAIQPPTRPVTFDDIAYLAGSVDGLPPDLSANTKKYLRATGYGGKRSR